jgi:hypothetical protein
MMVSPASDTYCSIRVGWPRRVKVFRMPIVFPSGSSPEERFISNLINHILNKMKGKSKNNI